MASWRASADCPPRMVTMPRSQASRERLSTALVNDDSKRSSIGWSLATRRAYGRPVGPAASTTRIRGCRMANGDRRPGTANRADPEIRWPRLGEPGSGRAGRLSRAPAVEYAGHRERGQMPLARRLPTAPGSGTFVEIEALSRPPEFSLACRSIRTLPAPGERGRRSSSAARISSANSSRSSGSSRGNR